MGRRLILLKIIDWLFEAEDFHEAFKKLSNCQDCFPNTLPEGDRAAGPMVRRAV
jgi:hypothetical protein